MDWTLWEWSRPQGLFALILPILVIARAFVRARPEERATGTLALWQRAFAANAAGGSRRRLELPLWLVLLALSLTAGALALAGPRKRPPEESATWHVVLDSSPSMFLPTGGGKSRLELACEELRVRLADSAVTSEATGIEWVRPRPDGVVERSLDTLPESWLRNPRNAWPETDWTPWDRAGHIWLTDDARGLEPDVAGVMASGGDLVPGPVAIHGTTRIDWDGERLLEVAYGAERSFVACSSDIPERLRELFAVWARERGFEVRTDDRESDSCLLRFDTAGEGTDRELSAGRDGWSLSVSGRALELGAARAAECWLATTDGACVVSWERGRVTFALVDGRIVLSGAPESIAVSWASLWDQALLEPNTTVDVGERASAGPASWRAPVTARSEAPARGESDYTVAWIALASLALALLALIARLSRGPRPNRVEAPA